MPKFSGGPAMRSCLLFVLLTALGLTAPGNRAFGQNNNNPLFGNNAFNNVGGITIDPHGVLEDVQRVLRDHLKSRPDERAVDVPAELEDGAELRKVSLRDLIGFITAARADGEDAALPEAVLFMGGLQRIRYVFVYPEQNDIVLAGPAEPWRRDDLGNPVGVTTGKPVVRLEYFLGALRAAFAQNRDVISCSIEPTPEGVRRMQDYLDQIAEERSGRRDADRIAQEIEQRLGLQNVRLTGVDPQTRFAAMLVAADYRMKRLAMGFEKSPLQGMPSYLDMIRSPRSTNMMPRWWIEDDYEALLTDDEGLAWELRGLGVRVLTEDELVGEDGTRQATGKVSPLAKKWADTMTAKYDQLSARFAVFGDLRNCMDVAVISALIASERLHEKAGLDLGDLLNDDFVPLARQAPPKHVPSQVSYRRTRGHLVLTASGGVQIRSAQVAGRHERSDSLAANRQKATAPANARWWWD